MILRLKLSVDLCEQGLISLLQERFFVFFYQVVCTMLIYMQTKRYIYSLDLIVVKIM
jgi:hypothetical protein